jgi:hypothetical protein
MDGTQFDTLIKRLSATPLTRATALRGLAASAATLAGVRLTEEPGAAKKNKKDENEVRICLWSASGGRSKKVERSKAKTILRRNACARKGRCSGTNPCPAGVPASGATGLTGPAGPAGPAGPGAGLVCPALCPFCEICNPATGQCEACPANCNFCSTLYDRSTVCGESVATSCVPCTTSADCPQIPNVCPRYCVVNSTSLSTHQTDSLCTTPFVFRYCASICPCE